MRKRWRWREATAPSPTADSTVAATVGTEPAAADDPAEPQAAAEATEIGESGCDPNALARAWSLPPLVAQLLYARGIRDREQARQFLDPTLHDLTPPAAIAGLDEAAKRLARAVAEGQPIVIYGDYDVDGVTAAAILYHTLTMAGGRVQTYVPHRVDEGYGLNQAALDQLADPPAGDPLPLVVTVDCGIAAVDEAAYAKSLGLELIITDHHHADPANLPEASALVHPRLSERDQPPPAAENATSSSSPADAMTDQRARCADLCGAGVAFKLAWQTARHHCGSERLPEAFKRLMLDLLSYVALGTVADVVPLVGENRVLTVFGLGAIKQTRFAGLNAMIDAARLRDERIDAYHVGFVLGPRLNACGRMGHAREAVRLLTTDDANEAAELASFLTKENDRRRTTERAIFDEAKQLVHDQGYDSADHRALVLAKENWHPGVIGIVASRLVEQFARPVVMLNCDNGTAKGSARSVPGIHMHEAFTACSAHLAGFGGHEMAAGLSLPSDNIDAFRQALVDYVNARLSPEDLTGLVEVDASVSLVGCKLSLFDQLMRLAPFGRGNPSPRLLVENAVLDQPPQRVGQEGKHLSLIVRQGQTRTKAIGFQMGELADGLAAGERLDLVFEPKVNTYRGSRKPELHLIDLQRSAEVAPADSASPSDELERGAAQQHV